MNGFDQSKDVRSEAFGGGKIAVLPPDVANKIAAGEVIERPASVVRELVENSLDAGAKRIDVVIEDGGATRIVVEDDGDGMTRADAVLAFERHATSKIRAADDLARIGTYGFRGEALPSIASVSRVTMTTRRSSDNAGTCVRIEGGRAEPAAEAGCPAGTSIVVGDLFFNVPARKRFLKATATETGRVAEIVRRHALANPAVHFTFATVAQGSRRERLVAPACASLIDRAAAVFGDEVGAFFPFDRTANGVRARGLFAAPEESVATAEGITMFVNGRPVRDRVLVHGVLAGFQSLLERGRYPVVVLFVEMDAALVDVNVHPQKSEVRFADGRVVHAAVSGALSGALASTPWITRTNAGNRTYVVESRETPGRFFPAAHASRAAGTNQATFAFRAAPTATATPDASAIATEEPTASRYSSLRVIGRYANTYVLCDEGDALVVIDQHAAHERVVFERMKAREGARATVQRLLLPVNIHLAPAELAALEAAHDVFESVGFEFTAVGAGQVVLYAVPSFAAGRTPERVFRDVLREVSEADHTRALANARDRAIATIACHAAVRAGDELTADECDALLRDLDTTPNNGNCPHGRPIVTRLLRRDLEKRFHRP
ncbi:MAG: DNA mismatch repair endonuclease MutL [Deltaproteobacteria bacterium]|nr:DNA mismatch repair endonuclease MutL [Deltaproteobacteria bacterium]